jgi:uncharacterized C2H2 Zn-finger protein
MINTLLRSNETVILHLNQNDSVLISIKCKYCDIVLRGKKEFIGHMFHSHELNLGDLEKLWRHLNPI